MLADVSLDAETDRRVRFVCEAGDAEIVVENGVNLEIMRAAQVLNDAMPGYVIEKLQVALGGSLQGKTVAVLGLAFKAGTSDARRSPGVHMANVLVQAGAVVRVFDPKAMAEAVESLDETVLQTAGMQSAMQGADAVIIATDWPEFVAYKPKDYAKLLPAGVFVDAMNRFDPAAVTKTGLHYVGVGR